MNNEQNKVSDLNSPYQQTPTINNQEEPLPEISEDEKVTLRILPDSPDENDSPEGDFYAYKPFDWVIHQPQTVAESSSSDESDGQVSEIALDRLTPDDQIIIETTHNIYHFTVVNPKLLYGTLIGGILGNQAACATLKFPHNERSAGAVERLKLGLSIVFNIEWGDNLRQLITSAITRLQFRRGKRSSRPNPATEKHRSNSSFITLRLDEP